MAIGTLLRAIHGYQGNFITQSALCLAPLTFVRPGELRKAEWSEIDLEAAEWRIPAERMKMRAIHIVPLGPGGRSAFASCTRSRAPDATSSPACAPPAGR